MPEITDAERKALLDAAIIREASEPERYFWLSFADGRRPKGTQFLGATIVRSTGLATASRLCWELGINPGGEVMSADFGEDDIGPDKIPQAHIDFMLNRLRSREEMTAEGIV